MSNGKFGENFCPVFVQLGLELGEGGSGNDGLRKFVPVWGDSDGEAALPALAVRPLLPHFCGGASQTWSKGRVEVPIPV